MGERESRAMISRGCSVSVDLLARELVSGGLEFLLA